MENVISLKAYRTIKETQKLFAGYRTRVEKMGRDEMLEEMKRYRQEAEKYPFHLLTLIKGQILMGSAKRTALTPAFREFAMNEEARLKEEVAKRLRSDCPN